MVTVGLLVRLLAKPGKEAEVAGFLQGGLSLVQEEPETTAWFAVQLGPSEFGIFDAFPDDAGRQAHLTGQVAAALMAQAPELLAQPPVIEPVDVLAAKLPGQLPDLALLDHPVVLLTTSHAATCSAASWGAQEPTVPIQALIADHYGAGLRPDGGVVR